MTEGRQLRPGNRYLRGAEERRTLGQVVADKAALVVRCRRCKHQKLIFAQELAHRLGAGFRVSDLGRRLRCGGCRALGMATVHESSR